MTFKDSNVQKHLILKFIMLILIPSYNYGEFLNSDSELEKYKAIYIEIVNLYKELFNNIQIGEEKMIDFLVLYKECGRLVSFASRLFL